MLQNLIETTASVGRDYLDEGHSSWRTAFTAGLGGGALMMVATLIKYSLSALKLPTFYEGILFSLNYATFFCIAYVLHFTIATKLPAHTAAALANSVQASGLGHAVRVRHFLRIWRAMIRLQIAGLLGNVLAAAPLAYLLDLIVQHTLDTHVLSVHTAEHVLHANTLLGPSIAYAALTGVFLWLSSLIGAAVDNWTRLTRLLERLATNLWVMRGVGERRARPVAEWFVQRAGGLAGNAALGIMLGGVPAFFAIAQLPMDIRHVTVAASSFALAFAADVGTPSELGFAATGVLVIGAVNVSASFALALQFALRANSRGTHGSARALVKLAIRMWGRGTKFALPSDRLAREAVPR